jgi:hypothetical protein
MLDWALVFSLKIFRTLCEIESGNITSVRDATDEQKFYGPCVQHTENCVDGLGGSLR